MLFTRLRRVSVLVAALLALGLAEATAQQTGEGGGRGEASGGGGSPGRDGGNSRFDRLDPRLDPPPPWRVRPRGPATVVIVEEPQGERRARRARPAVRSAPPRRTARRAPPPPAADETPSIRTELPSERADEIVALGLDEAALATLAGQGYAVRERVGLATLGELVRLGVPSGTTLAAAQATVLAAAPTATVDVNSIYIPGEAPCEGEACGQLLLVGWPIDGGSDACGEGVVLGVVDTGVNPDHPSLAAADVTLLPVLGDAPRVSKESHGTAVAAVLVGTGDPRIRGLLPRARLVAADAFVEDAAGRTHTDAFRLVAAIDTVAGAAPHALNLSLTGPANLILEKAVTAASEAGIAVVAAVGNDGPTAPPLYPAAYERVVAVTAVDANRAIYRRAVQGEHVDFAAPGVDVWTAASISGARPKTGTSFAAPFVTAALAVARHHGASDPAAAVARLEADAEDLGEPGRDRIFGWGLMGAGGLCSRPAAFATAAE